VSEQTNNEILLRAAKVARHRIFTLSDCGQRRTFLLPPAAMAGRMGVAPLYFALITALSLFLLLQITVSKYDVPTTDIAPTEDSLIISQRR